MFKIFFTAQKSEPHFLTTKSIGYYLEDLLSQASKFIIIISPYIKMSLRIQDILHDKKAHGIDISIICRENKNILPYQIFIRENLHAKCFITEKAALVGSMNLYDYSQINNDEMAFYFTKKVCSDLYKEVLQEAERLRKTFIKDAFYISKEKTILDNSPHYKTDLILGKKYSFEELTTFFSFCNPIRGGINQTERGNIVLFYNSYSKYKNKEENGILYYIGQNTGGETQALIYGNKLLYDCWQNPDHRIFVFKNFVYYGEYCLHQEPFMKNKQWIFPLQKKR